MSTNLRLILRFIGFVAGIAIGAYFGAFLASASELRDAGSTIMLIALSIGGIGYVLGPHVSRGVFRRVRQRIRDASLIDLVAITVGLVVGGVASALLAVPVSYLPDPAGSVFPFIIALALCTVAIGITLSRKRELVGPWLPTIPDDDEADPAEKVLAPEPITLLDTNILIDGRVVELLATGFLGGTLQIPRFILAELQYIADASEPLRRQRGRRGLDVVARLREEYPDLIDIVDLPDSINASQPVDSRLVETARAIDARILTNDFNLNQVAAAQDVSVLNLNELSRVMRAPVLPGEDLSLTVSQEGREPGQGVGFLDDGTMVVIDGGQSLVGQSVNVTVTRLLQTGAGRMVFATPATVPA
ncbi:MAG: PIN/TRAM domain-containing protein [Thermomicrobiales bacterium]